MTETFSIGEAMATPGRVIRRHPLAVFVWGFVMMAYSLGGAALMFGTLANLPLGEGAEPPPEMLGQMIAFQGVSMLLNVGQMLLAGGRAAAGAVSTDEISSSQMLQSRV